MKKDKRNFIIITKHKRWQRLWQFFFTGWGLIMIAALIAGAFFTKQLLWSPITAINMNDVITNQFKMSGATFYGTDQNGGPFKIMAETGRQEFDNPDTIFLEHVSGYMTAIENGKPNIHNFSANSAEYNRNEKKVRLIGNVKIKSDDGEVYETKELVIEI